MKQSVWNIYKMECYEFDFSFEASDGLEIYIIHKTLATTDISTV